MHIKQSYLTALLSFAGMLACVSCSLLGNDPRQFERSGPASVELTAATQDITIGLTCDKAWSASLKSGKWAVIMKEDPGTDNLNGSVQLHIRLNSEQAVRKDTLVIASGSKVLETEIVQKGIASFVSATTLSFDRTLEQTVEINAVSAWKMTTVSGNWFTLSSDTGAPGKSTVTFTAKARQDDYDARSGEVVFKSGTDELLLNLVQSQTDVLLVTPEVLTIGCRGGSLSLTAQYNVKYEVSCSADWLRLAPTKALNQDVLVFTVDENPAEEERSAELVFTADGSILSDGQPSGKLSQTVVLTQSGTDPLLRETAFGVYYADGRKTLYDPLTMQMGRYYDDTSVSFRMMNVEQASIIEVRGFGNDLREGETVTLTLVIDRKTAGEYESVLLQDDGQTAWLRATDGTGFILKI